MYIKSIETNKDVIMNSDLKQEAAEQLESTIIELEDVIARIKKQRGRVGGFLLLLISQVELNKGE